MTKAAEAGGVAGCDVSEIAQTCLLMRTRLISRVLTGIFDQELRPFGINSPQFVLLVVIATIGPASRAEIGRFNRQDRSTLTRNLQRMLAEGWIAEAEGKAGGRGRPIVLTQAGTDLLQHATPAWQAAQARAQAVLGGGGASVITGIANTLIEIDPAP
jgi:DNA-binding MarR family transcriptional regulator